MDAQSCCPQTPNCCVKSQITSCEDYPGCCEENPECCDLFSKLKSNFGLGATSVMNAFMSVFAIHSFESNSNENIASTDSKACCFSTPVGSGVCKANNAKQTSEASYAVANCR